MSGIPAANLLKEYRQFQNSTVRLYGKIVNDWSVDDGFGRPITRQVEVTYTDYNVKTGEIVGEGTEDFSRSNYDRVIAKRYVWSWDGKRRNKGGKRWFDLEGSVRIRKNEKKNVLKLLQKHWHPDAVMLELRE